MCWFVSPPTHYGPDPMGYEFSKWGTYHRADRNAVGIDRGPCGTGFTEQYAPPLAKMYGGADTCPEELLLFFHRVQYDHVLKSGKTLLQQLYDAHFQGADAAEGLLAAWRTLEGMVAMDMYENVLRRLERQTENAREWRDVFNAFFFRMSGVGDEKNRIIYG